MNIAAKHGWPGTAAILISVGLHGSVYAVLSTIDGPAPVLLPSEPVMAYIVPVPRFIPEPPAAPIEPVTPEEPIQAPPPEPEAPPADEPEPEPLRPAQADEPLLETEAGPETADEPAESATVETQVRPRVTRFQWYAAIPEAIARMRAAEAQAPQYREFGNLDALTAGAGSSSAYAPDTPDAPADGFDVLPFASWGEERVQLNENCYASRPAPGTVLAEVYRLTNPMINCEGSSRAEPRNDLFIEAMPPYLEEN